MTNPLAQDLGGVVRLLEKATPGGWKVVEEKLPWSLADGRTGAHTQRRICTEWDHPQLKGPIGITNLAFGVGLHDAERKGVQFVSMSLEDAEAIIAAVSFLRTHSAEIAGALAAFQRVRDALEQPDLIGPASHFRSEEEVIQTRVLRALIRHELNWHTAMQQGGGGGEAAA